MLPSFFSVGVFATNYSISMMSVGFLHIITVTQPLFTLFWTSTGIIPLQNPRLHVGQIVCIFVLVAEVVMSSSIESTFSWSAHSWGGLCNLSAGISFFSKGTSHRHTTKKLFFSQMSLLGFIMLLPVLKISGGSNPIAILTDECSKINVFSIFL